MSLFLKTLYASITGALGGLLAWLILDVLVRVEPANPYGDAVLNGALVGACIGAAVNGFAGLMEFKPLPFIRGLLIGLVAGALGGAAGLAVGQFLYQAAGNHSLVRIVGWGIFGLCLGVADGLLALSLRRVVYAGLGGLIGGLFGGTASTLLAGTENLVHLSRALGFVVVGALIGLFVGLVPTVLKDAWLKVISSGRNEGKERIADRPRISIGSSSRCDLCLYDDPAVKARHAEIAQDKGQYILKSVGDAQVMVPAGPQGMPVSSYILQDNDRFVVGNQTIIFRRRRSG